MKNLFAFGLLISSLLFTDGSLFAQRDHFGGRRHRDRNVIVNEPHRFPRNKVVVVEPHRVHRMKVLPSGYSAVMFGGRNYFYHAGLFYALMGGVYSVINPPIGLHIRILPDGYRRVVIAGMPYFYFGGVYYQRVGNEYATVNPPVGAIVPELPMDNVDKVTIDGETYYKYDNVLYKPIVTPNGVQYKVAGKLDN